MRHRKGVRYWTTPAAGERKGFLNSMNLPNLRDQFR